MLPNMPMVIRRSCRVSRCSLEPAAFTLIMDTCALRRLTGYAQYYMQQAAAFCPPSLFSSSGAIVQLSS